MNKLCRLNMAQERCIGRIWTVYAYKIHTKIRCEYSIIKRWLRCQDILRIQKIGDAHTIKKSLDYRDLRI